MIVLISAADVIKAYKKKLFFLCSHKTNLKWCYMIKRQGVRGLGFKFVDFIYKSSDVCYIEV